MNFTAKRVKHQVDAAHNAVYTSSDVPDSVTFAMNIPEIQEAVINQLCQLGSSQKATLLCLRLVSKDWMISVSSALRKRGYPLCNLVVYKSYFAERLEEPSAIRDFSRAYWNGNYLPTFTLTIRMSCFRNKIFDALRVTLTKAASALVAVQVCPGAAYKDDLRLPDILSSNELKLPNLQSILVINNERGIDTSAFKIIDLVNHLITASSNLKKFQVRDFGCILKNVKLPLTVTNLEVLKLSIRDLKLLANTSLPELHTLDLTALPIISEVEELVFTVLNNFKNTLRQLTLRSGQFVKFGSGLPVHFPVMEKLRNLVFKETNFQFEPKVASQSEITCFPELTSLEMVQKESAFCSWTVCSSLDTVTKLTLSLRGDREPKQIMPIAGDTMRLLCKAFPNLVWLRLDMCVEEMSGLELLFQNMSQLEYLHLFVYESWTFKFSHFWDALLTGKNNSGVWRRGGNTTGDTPSIRMLSNLKTLCLSTCGIGMPEEFLKWPLISGFTFEHAFLKMPTLKALSFDGRFQIPNEYKDKWLSEGRFIATVSS